MPNSGSPWDVAIIGAGPGGSSAAIELARAGRRVLLIEKTHFPRDKVCGGCLSGRAMARVRRLYGSERPLPGVAEQRITFVIGSYRMTCRPDGRTRMALRSELDTELVGLAVAAGAEARFGEKATLVRGAQAWEVAVGAERVRATTIIVAAGLGGMAARLGITGRPQRRRMIAQQWFQPAVPPLPAVGEVEMHWLRGGYVGLATPAPGRCVVALSAEAPHDGESAWDHLHRLNPTATVWSLLPPDALRRYSAKGTAGFPWWPQQLGIENVLLVGDAAGYDEPFTGEGMGQALSSGLCAAEAILRGGDILQYYTKLMRSRHVPVRRRLRWISRILRWPFLNTLAAGPVLLPPALLASIVRWVHVGA